MQDALLALTNYWTDRGCLIVQPVNTEVGAGTYNPATVLRVLGPEPWRVAYVEPSVRPDDSRYGENPNRLQTHTQFQVILKPDPGNPQELYLGSLEALGIDVRAHDIRFVEDNWASPALGAWGLGWEVWLDGLEITQFTYFQQAGGQSLDPVSVEITYGIERIVMALQGVDHFKEIAYAPGISYGEAFGQAEYEMSRYYLDDADVATNQRLFEEYATEARRMVDAGLPVPAHSYVLKCSHAFNVLDSRGAISTTERARAFGRMRALARDVAKLWTQRREELGHPLGVVTPPPAATLPATLPEVTAPATLLFEIGTEELPAAEVTRTVEAVRAAVADKLAGTRLGHGEVSVHGTPRRIVVLVDQVQPREPDAERTARGPRVSAAFDADGQPTRAALGFARGQGVDVAELGRVEADGVEYVGLARTEAGRGAVEVLSGLLAQVVGELRAERNIRWKDAGLSFSRPIRWLLALLGDTVVPVAVSSLNSGGTTRVHRTDATPVVDVPGADGYVEFLARHGIDVDGTVRRERIVAGATGLAASVGGSVDALAEAALVDEVTNLVERPTPILGGFAQRYLDLPAEILTTVMRKHQRYLPVRDDSGALLPHFVAVANGSCDPDLVRAGYEAVLRARYEDAAFFWRADLETPLAQLKTGLEKLTFADKLGSMADRADRIAGLAGRLADQVELADTDRATLARAGELAKFDLGSQMVIELSSLAGVMAREYAARAGEPQAVADALFEMELPRQAGDALPKSAPGALLALADRFDLLVGLFGIGANPTGSSDPFGLRRAALGAVSILRSAADLRGITLASGLTAAANLLADKGFELADGTVEAVREFAVRRYEQQLLDAGHDHRFVNAVLPLADAPAEADAALAQLTGLAGDAGFGALVAALQRVRRIVPAGTLPGYDPAALVEPAELALHEAVRSVRDGLGGRRLGLAEFVAQASALTGPVNAFFDGVLVMAEDEKLRRARLGLLATVRDLAADVLDWQALGTALA
ncbi:glycine--tRNA ligase [Solihabitans fulvus]|uniref:Multifunctional fusion protein n=1 Tax=Solihabitans fulvus TaxID=1892852 RepID=A0A5B2XE65_9PSEU|nr:glycine--tRNA ligase [Solihabitans fulvus]KAA2261349.1 glycine--tRNA ligase [Solihabitans fulvus]